jgi:hypothetical protein
MPRTLLTPLRVHISSGVSALVCALVLGRRREYGHVPMPPFAKLDGERASADDGLVGGVGVAGKRAHRYQHAIAP